MRKRALRAISGATAITSGLLAGIAAVAAAQAAPMVSVPCSVTALITAINNANGSGPSLINLAPNCTYTLTAKDNSTDGGNGLPVVKKTVTLTGSNTTIERSSATRFRILEVRSSSSNAASLTIQGITISGGKSGLFTSGGCLLATTFGLNPMPTTLRLLNSAVEDCSASISGGGIYADSGTTASVDSSEVNDNSATLAGGGVYLAKKASLSVSYAKVNDNSALGSGGGAYVASSALATFGHSFVNDNSTLVQGGGLTVSGHATLTSSTLAGNSAAGVGGGLYNTGTTNLGASFVLGNKTLLSGGGIYAGGSSDTRIVATRVQNNIAAVRGGGIDNNGHALLWNSFVIQNTAASGGGIYETGSIIVLNSVIFGNLVNNCSPVGSVPFCVN